MEWERYFRNKEFPRYATINRHSALQPYHQLINDWLSQENYQATRIYELAVTQGYKGSYETVKRYVRKVKEKRDRIAYVRFETIPGLQAQVDFGDFKVISSEGKEETVYAFVMVLGYSRQMYVEFMERCAKGRFLDAHRNAFGWFGGVPGEIIYDNMKNVVIGRHVRKAVFNETMLEFGVHYHFKPVACPPYSPWYKGKVERPIHYIRERFWRGYRYGDLASVNRDIRHWLDSVASDRIHGTTRQRVRERFLLEKPHLGEVPNRPYDTSGKVIRKVYKDCQVSFGGNLYVVPHRYVGSKVLLKVKEGILRIFHDDTELVVYRIPGGKGCVVADPRFYGALKTDREQIKRKYRISPVKGKATRGLLKHGIMDELVQKRPLSEYDVLAEVSHV